MPNSGIGTLLGWLDVEIIKNGKHVPHRVKGTDFSWEEGGEHSSTFLFVHSDHSRDFKIFIGFSTEDGKIFDWTIRSSTEKVRIFNDDAHDHLEVPERFLNYDPESF